MTGISLGPKEANDMGIEYLLSDEHTGESAGIVKREPQVQVETNSHHYWFLSYPIYSAQIWQRWIYSFRSC